MAKEINEEVFAVVDTEEEVYTQTEAEEEEVKTKGTFTFEEAINIDGVFKKSIEYDFGRVTPIEYINIVKGVSKKEQMSVPELNLSVQANLFCKAAGIPASVIKTQMKLNDFTGACRLSRDFLLSSRAAEEDDLL